MAYTSLTTPTALKERNSSRLVSNIPPEKLAPEVANEIYTTGTQHCKRITGLLFPFLELFEFYYSKYNTTVRK